MHRQNTIAWYAGALAAVVLLALLAAAVATGNAAPFDSLVRDAIHRQASPNLTQLALLFSFVGSAWIWIPATVLAIGVLWFGARRKAALAVLASMAGAVVLDNGLKLLFHRARPLGFFAADPRTYSFPSGHALFAACLYGALVAILAAGIHRPMWRAAIWAGALLMILSIGLSRIYLGVHYPTDVLAGYLVGGAWLALLRAMGVFGSADGAATARDVAPPR
jgi:undecaprenyl-diphosphatase